MQRIRAAIGPVIGCHLADVVHLRSQLSKKRSGMLHGPMSLPGDIIAIRLVCHNLPAEEDHVLASQAKSKAMSRVVSELAIANISPRKAFAVFAPHRDS
jgi:hypothetical protein